MHLKEVVLSNFRCFESLTVPLHPRLTVLVAENAGGKTSILDGIAIGLSPVLRYLSTADQRLSGPGIEDTDFRLKSWQGTGGIWQRGASDFSQVLLETTSGLRWAHWRASAKGKQPNTKTGQSDLTSYASDVLESLKSPHPRLMPVFAYYGARRGWIVIPERIRESKIDYSQRSSALFGALKSLSDFKEMLKWFDVEEATELRANKGKSPEDFEVSPTLTEVRSAISAILGGAYANPHFDLKHKFVIEARGANEPDLLQVSQLSQGYQSMLALAMDFARRLALANGHLYSAADTFDWSFARQYVEQCHPEGLQETPPLGPAWAPAIMLVDEIDLHLHPSWQQRVLPDLMRAFPGTQFIVTTHSPQVLTTVKRENIRLLEKAPDGTWQANLPPTETKGVENSVAMNDVMKVNPVPPVIEATWLNDYVALIETGNYANERARDLRAKLINHYGESHQIILDCDRLLRFQAFKNRRV